MASIKQEQVDAAEEFVSAAVDALKTEHGVHVETAVAGIARMAGTFLFRSFDFTTSGIMPGQTVLSGNANEEGPRLVQLMGGVLAHIGVALDDGKLGGAPEPEHMPTLEFLETQKRLEPAFQAIRERHGLSLQEAADAGAVATALMIKRCGQALDPHIAFAVAVYGFIEGSKTAPDPVAL
jgi:hypothetical protein